MSNSQKGRFQSALTTGLLLGLSMSLRAAVAAEAVTSPLTTQFSARYPEIRMVLAAGSAVVSEPIRYPSGAPALITAMEIVLQPGQQTGWHTHPMLLFGYILEGKLTVDYGPNGQRIYRKGDGLAEAINEAHNGRNMSENPVRILAVFIGIEGLQQSLPASPPAR
jgi:quercetin dioxygenase-like cupin family protein